MKREEKKWTNWFLSYGYGMVWYVYVYTIFIFISKCYKIKHEFCVLFSILIGLYFIREIKGGKWRQKWKNAIPCSYAVRQDTKGKCGSSPSSTQNANENFAFSTSSDVSWLLLYGRDGDGCPNSNAHTSSAHLHNFRLIKLFREYKD